MMRFGASQEGRDGNLEGRLAELGRWFSLSEGGETSVALSNAVKSKTSLGASKFSITYSLGEQLLMNTSNDNNNNMQSG